MSAVQLAVAFGGPILFGFVLLNGVISAALAEVQDERDAQWWDY